MNRKYGLEHIEWIKANIRGCHFKDLTDMFNERFGMDLKVSAMIPLAARHGLHNGIDARLNTGWEPTQFKKGHVPTNKGKKGIGGWEPTQFKKGNKPVNYRPVGSERVNAYGYVEVKVADPNKWRLKHQVIWEEHNGPVPKGYVVLFGDGNPCNFDTNNFILVSRQQLLILNKNKLIKKDADLTRTAVIIADLFQKINQRKSSK